MTCRPAASGALPPADAATVAAWRALVQACPDPAWVVALPSLQVVVINAAATAMRRSDSAGAC